ncbi:MAG: CCA tRNA nucleotidyltransferase, partial [Pseudomonadota bacterium]
LDLPDLPAAAAVIMAIEAAGHQARYAGGVVRDCLLGRPLGDVDLATTADPDLIIQALEKAEIRAIPTGVEHGTVTAVVEGGGAVEVTALRRDVETDGRHAVVKFGADWAEDARRRDFTLNALFADADGTLHDFVGGVSDALAGRVRFVGDPDTRIREDYLRILRFFRFQAQLGRTEPHEDLLRILKQHAGRLADLSSERLTRELLGLLAARNPAPTWAAAIACGVDDIVLGCRTDAAPLARLVEHEHQLGLAPSALRRLSLLTDGSASRLALSNADREDLRSIAALKRQLASGSVPGETAIKTGLYHHGRDRYGDGLLAAWAVSPSWPADTAEQAMRTAQALTVPNFPVSGQDVLDLGIVEGPAVGETLRQLEAWWLEGGLTASRQDCLETLRRYSTRIV